MDRQFKWALPGPFTPWWRHWEAESVLFDAESGNTYLVETLASSILGELESSMLSTSELLVIFGEGLPPEAAYDHLTAALAGLEANNLVRRIPA